MFGKIFATMYKGSLYGHWEALVTFQQMIVLADLEGIVDMTPEVLAATTSIPLDIIRKGIAELEAVDPESRTPGEDGRRIIRLDDHRTWGWRIVNYLRYRKIQSTEERRDYHRQYWRDKRSPKSTKTQQDSTPFTEPQQHSTNSTNSRSRGKKQKEEEDGGGRNRAAAIVGRFPEEYQPEIRNALRAAHSPESLAAELGAILDGVPPRVPYTPTVLGQAVRDLILSGGKITGKALAAFCLRVPGVAADTTGDEWTRIAKKLEAEYRA